MKPLNGVNALLENVPLPDMIHVRQKFPEKQLEYPVEALKIQLSSPAFQGLVQPGMTIAITAGSRGIDQYAPLLHQIVKSLQDMGASPFIIPAMGSHGGATAQGQKALLAGYGITEETMGVPILSSMEVVQVTKTDDGEGVFVDRYAHEADGIVLFNRVKPHTGFRGEFESGLIKMAAIGLGKQKGAESVHGGGPALMAKRVYKFGAKVIEHSKILFGVATVENAFDKVCMVKALTVPQIYEEEPKLLAHAKAQLPSIFFENLDVLLVDRIGKNISGPGMDPNITHTYLPGAAISETLRAKRATRVVVFDLTDETHGSAMGIGMADITTRRLFDKMDLDHTYPNCLTSGVTASAKIPMFFDSQKLAIQAAVQTLTATPRTAPRLVRIRDTLHLDEIWISSALLSEAKQHPDVEILSSPEPMQFDVAGNLF